MKNLHRYIFFVFLLLIACGPKARLSPELKLHPPRFLVVLPIKAPSTMRPVRVAFLRNVIEESLRNEGFFLLDSTLVERICGSAQCPEKQEFIERFQAQGFIDIEIESNSSRDIGLAFYNDLVGKIVILGRDFKRLGEIGYAERKYGGILLQSGQVVDAFRDQYANFKDDGFNLLAKKFAEKVVSALPRPSNVENFQAVEARLAASINKVITNELTAGVYKICLQGTPKSLAFFIYDRNRANLREVHKGNYCGNFFLGSGHSEDELKHVEQGRRFRLELRSPFGRPVVQDLQLPYLRKVSKIS